MPRATRRRRRRARSIKTTRYIAGLLGIAIVAYLIADIGGRKIADTLLIIGWGLVPVTLFHLVPMVLSTLSWRDLLALERRPRLAILVWARWIRESINSLLPVGQVGGDVVCVRLIYLRGAPGAPATASMIVDLTVGAFTQLVFVAIGLVLLLFHSTAPDVLEIVRAALFGLAIFLVAIGVFFLLQRRGIFGLTARIAGGLAKIGVATRMAGKASEVDIAVRAIYADKAAFWRAMAWRLAGWMAGTGEIWLLMYFLGAPVTLAEAFILESLSSGVRAAAFLIPGALGVLEGSFIVFAALFGIPASAALTLALGKRVRELALGIPGLIAWQMTGIMTPDRKPTARSGEG